MEVGQSPLLGERANGDQASLARDIEARKVSRKGERESSRPPGSEDRTGPGARESRKRLDSLHGHVTTDRAEDPGGPRGCCGLAPRPSPSERCVTRTTAESLDEPAQMSHPVREPLTSRTGVPEPSENKGSLPPIPRSGLVQRSRVAERSGWRGSSPAQDVTGRELARGPRRGRRRQPVVMRSSALTPEDRTTHGTPEQVCAAPMGTVCWWDSTTEYQTVFPPPEPRTLLARGPRHR